MGIESDRRDEISLLAAASIARLDTAAADSFTTGPAPITEDAQSEGAFPATDAFISIAVADPSSLMVEATAARFTRTGPDLVQHLEVMTAPAQQSDEASAVLLVPESEPSAGSENRALRPSEDGKETPSDPAAIPTFGAPSAALQAASIAVFAQMIAAQPAAAVARNDLEAALAETISADMSASSSSASEGIFFIAPALVPSDALYGAQWQLFNATSGINVQRVWDTYRGDGIRIAAIDDGVDYYHRIFSRITASISITTRSAATPMPITA